MTARFSGLLTIGALALAASSLHATQSAPARPQAAASAVTPPSDALLRQYCFGCHNDQRRIGGLALDRANLQTPEQSAEIWEKVIRKLRSGAMPPQGVPQPGRQASMGLVTTLERSLDSAAARRPNPGRKPATHRLNRVEYANAIRDLLALEIDPSILPPDDSGYGFDNIADVLTVSPMLTERYLSAALRISRAAVGNPAILPVTDTFTVSKYLKQTDRVSESLPFGSRGGLAIRHDFPVDADYVVKVFFERTYDGRVRGLGEAQDLEVRLNGALVKRVTVGEDADTATGRGRGGNTRIVDLDGLEVRFPAKAGPAVVGVSFVKKANLPEGMQRPPYAVTSYEYAGDISVPTSVGSIELRGPYDVKGSGDAPSRQRIFICEPSRPADRTACARRILSTLARRAYRRPVVAADVDPLMAFFEKESRTGSFDSGIEAALRRLLVSPDFLFRTEHDPSGMAPGRAYRISDVELASRLSFFLWSSIPDDELLDLAARGQLSKPEVLERQVTRMFEDRKSRALVSNFAGQWLHLRNIKLVTPDPAVFPDFDDNLRLAFQSEAELFLDSQIREDHSVVELLTADYTFLNERLARHYGIPNVYGSHFRRVTLTDENRLGLLGKGGILTLTSYANRTSPVLRGKWLLENLLGAPPPPPPPDVPALQESGAGTAAKPVRERLEQHRVNPACAGCHKVMDPLGFALENFDAIGRWRTSDAGTPIDASGVLIDGTKVAGPSTLRRALVAQREEFVRTVTKKLMTYALGRGVEYFDQPTIRAISAEAAAHDYRWSSLVRGIAQSTPFRMRLSGPAPIPDNGGTPAARASQAEVHP